MTKLSETSLTAIAITFLVMNLSALLKEVLSLLLCIFYLKIVLAVILISYLYILAKNDNKNLLITFLEQTSQPDSDFFRLALIKICQCESAKTSNGTHPIFWAEKCLKVSLGKGITSKI